MRKLVKILGNRWLQIFRTCPPKFGWTISQFFKKCPHYLGGTILLTRSWNLPTYPKFGLQVFIGRKCAPSPSVLGGNTLCLRFGTSPSKFGGANVASEKNYPPKFGGTKLVSEFLALAPPNLGGQILQVKKLPTKIRGGNISRPIFGTCPLNLGGAISIVTKSCPPKFGGAILEPIVFGVCPPKFGG